MIEGVIVAMQWGKLNCSVNGNRTMAASLCTPCLHITDLVYWIKIMWFRHVKLEAMAIDSSSSPAAPLTTARAGAQSGLFLCHIVLSGRPPITLIQWSKQRTVGSVVKTMRDIACLHTKMQLVVLNCWWLLAPLAAVPMCIVHYMLLAGLADG